MRGPTVFLCPRRPEELVEGAQPFHGNDSRDGHRVYAPFLVGWCTSRLRALLEDDVAAFQ